MCSFFPWRTTLHFKELQKSTCTVIEDQTQKILTKKWWIAVKVNNDSGKFWLIILRVWILESPPWWKLCLTIISNPKLCKQLLTKNPRKPGVQDISLPLPNASHSYCSYANFLLENIDVIHKFLALYFLFRSSQNEEKSQDQRQNG